jgi:hypothetical protein
MRKAARLAGWLGMLASASCASAALAQNSGASGSVLYGRGVDAYFSGDTTNAELFLGQAIAELPDDPRPYYFRALTLLRSGRQADSQSDMEIGASLEARRPKQFGVGKALERVQGSERLVLEKYRRQGGAAATIQQDDQVRGRYDQRVRPESNVMRDSLPSSQQVQRQQNRTTASSGGDPFADDSPKSPAAVERPRDPFANGPSEAASEQRSGSAATDSSTADGKAPSGKLMGVLGRVLGRTVPLPSIEGLRNESPQSPPAATNRGENSAKPGDKLNKKPAQTDNSEDPFGSP